MAKVETVKVLSPAEAAFEAITAKATPGPRGKEGERGERGERGIAGLPGSDGIGLPGTTGEQGKQGDRGDKGDRGDVGSVGQPGEKGDHGETPDHKWRSTALSFKKPDGTWGKERELRGMPGTGGGGSTAGGSIIRDISQLSDRQNLLGGGFELIIVDTPTFAINADTDQSYRIFHVSHQGDVEITVPLGYPEASVIAINNETGGNTVTITGEI
jgi:hypothetical protein